MGCSSCGTKDGLPGGCKNNGTCGTDGCNKLTVFDWLSNMQPPNNQERFPAVEIRFKNDRKEFFVVEKGFQVHVGELVAVEVQSGHDIGAVSLTGELVRVQMRKKRMLDKLDELPKVYRKANEKDILTWKEFKEKEYTTMKEARHIAHRLGLDMKISDVEFQGDGNKAIFFYTAEDRVDFRQLIREFAARFHVRIEMRQIGFRQEASKVGGIGSCGRELCCSTWLTDFRSVRTESARYQQLSINPQKLAGQCGKLKCCLNFELDSYLDALADIPSIETVLKTKKGKARCMKVDVFKRDMWLWQEGGVTWHKFSVDQVKEFIQINKSGKSIDDLEELAKENVLFEPSYKDVIEENSLDRFERKNRRNKKRKPSRRRNNNKTESADKSGKTTQRASAPKRQNNKRKPKPGESEKSSAPNKRRPNNRNKSNKKRPNYKRKPDNGKSSDTNS